ncbi:MAG: hypothetical protein K0V04_36855 [Deltaproteobacteria bacterium]|nr:hypothetical protein [Deltaproteobacteria bacterium]
MSHATVASLSDVLGYRNAAVVAAFGRRFDVSPEQAELLFDDTLRWLWLCGKLRATLRQGIADAPCSSLAITPSMKLIDEMWHTFLLFSADYRQFCDAYVGGFVDHLPEAPAPATPTPATDSTVRDRIEGQLEYVHDELGEAVLRRWYVEYADLHTLEHVDRIHRSLAAQEALRR